MNKILVYSEKEKSKKIFEICCPLDFHTIAKLLYTLAVKFPRSRLAIDTDFGEMFLTEEKADSFGEKRDFSTKDFSFRREEKEKTDSRISEEILSDVVAAESNIKRNGDEKLLRDVRKKMKKMKKQLPEESKEAKEISLLVDEISKELKK